MDLSNIKYINSTFAGCSYLTFIPDEFFTNSNITNFNDIFLKCTSLTPYSEYLRKQRRAKLDKILKNNEV